MLKLKKVKNKPLKLKISQSCPSVEVDAILQDKSCCPSVEDVVIEPDAGFDGLSRVVVQATPLEETTVTPLTTRQVIKPSEEVVGLSSVEVEPVTKDIDENIIPENIRSGVSILGVEGTCVSNEGLYDIKVEDTTLMFVSPINVEGSELIL